MGFIDEAAGGGGPPILKFNKEACYAKSGSDESFNDQEFIADVLAARGGYIKFGEKGQAPEKHLGSIFPKDEAPLRFSLATLTRVSGPKVGSQTSRKTLGRRCPLKHKERAKSFCSAPNLRPRLVLQGISSRRLERCHTGSSLSSALVSAASNPSSGQSKNRC